MSAIIIPQGFQHDVNDKLSLMQEDARFEVASDLDAEGTALRCAENIKSQKAPPKVPKTFMASKCIFNCAYCGCRSSRGDERNNYCLSPRELAQVSVEVSKRERHGVFVTSAIYMNADYTQELLAESVRIMRKELGYKGYIHAKVMPGADPLLIEKTGLYADRLSVNIEVAQSCGYERIAKQKNRNNILNPMRSISEQVLHAKAEKRRFATSQTTQIMAGSTEEDDRTILNLSQALYHKYRLSRVYYTAFSYRHAAKGYEMENLSETRTPYWRMARLYQADRLLQLYHFAPEEITPTDSPNLEADLDPKAAWALRHLELYPVELNQADFETLIRIPGIGLTFAKRILEARRHTRITFELLEKMRVSLKRSKFFITCNGQYKGKNSLFSQDLRHFLSTGAEQISIFDSLMADETTAGKC